MGADADLAVFSLLSREQLRKLGHTRVAGSLEYARSARLAGQLGADIPLSTGRAN
jgi:hypothetical protein